MHDVVVRLRLPAQGFEGFREEKRQLALQNHSREEVSYLCFPGRNQLSTPEHVRCTPLPGPLLSGQQRSTNSMDQANPPVFTTVLRANKYITYMLTKHQPYRRTYEETRIPPSSWESSASRFATTRGIPQPFDKSGAYQVRARG